MPRLRHHRQTAFCLHEPIVSNIGLPFIAGSASIKHFGSLDWPWPVVMLPARSPNAGLRFRLGLLENPSQENRDTQPMDCFSPAYEKIFGTKIFSAGADLEQD